MYFLEKTYARIKLSITRGQMLSFFAAVIAGFLSHGYAFFNNYIYHDATILDNIGNTFGLGRWTLGCIEYISGYMLGSYQLPFFNTFFSIFFIALSAMLIVRILNIRSNFLCIITGALLSVYPVVTSSFAYNFTALYYFIALFLAVLSVYIIVENDKKSYVIISSLVLAVSAGLYQAYLSVALTLAVSYIMLMLFFSELDIKHIIKKGIYAVTSFICGLFIYLLANTVFTKIVKPFETTYQGMEELGRLDIAKIPARIKDAYLHFFYIKWNGINTSVFMWILLVLVVLICFIIIITSPACKKCRLANKLIFLFLAIIYPLCVNLIYLFSTNENYSVHTLMRYATVFVVIFPAALADRALSEMDYKAVKSFLTPILEVLLSVIVISYIYSNNIAYFKMNIMQEEMTSFYNALRVRIQSQDGYNDNMPVVFAGEFFIDDETLFNLDELYPDTKILGYEYNIRDLINRESWKTYMKIHNGFSPLQGDLTGDIYDSGDFKNMTVYPEDGSVKVINGRVVVKFSENY